MVPGSVGSSSADSLISPHQRFTLKQPNIMNLPSFGCRTVVLNPYRLKSDLSPKGFVGTLLGRSATSIGAYNVWVNGKVVCSSAILCDEDYYPWRGKDSHQPLTPTINYSRPNQPIPAKVTVDPAPLAVASPGETIAQLNHPEPRRSLSFFTMFSGKYVRPKGLPDCLKRFGWGNVSQLDNHAVHGGGWADDVMNDSRYTSLKAEFAAGAHDVLFIAFPCTTWSMARFFNTKANQDGDTGPPVIYDLKHKDGLPLSEIDPKHHLELKKTKELLTRVTELARIARASPANTTIIWESPARRSIKGTNHFCEDLPLHSTVFDTTTFKDLVNDTGPWRSCTFSWCRFGSEAQKYTTFWYTSDAATALDPLNGPEYQCNHKGRHPRVAGGRLPNGEWATADFVEYPTELNYRIAMAATIARTGSHLPFKPNALPRETRRPTNDSEPIIETQLPQPSGPVLVPVSPGPEPNSPAADRPSPVRFGGFTGASSTTSLGPGSPDYVPFDPSSLMPAAQASDTHAAQPKLGSSRTSRASTKQSTSASHDLQDAWHQRLEAKRVARLEPVPESLSPDAEMMEAQVAALVRSANGGVTNDRGDSSPIGEWFDVPASRVSHMPPQISCLAEGCYHLEVDATSAEALLSSHLDPGVSEPQDAHVSLFSALASDIAPTNHREAAELGGKWTKAELKEMTNHANNGTWKRILRSKVPRGRHVHKLVWVFKIKRDGTAKARLCVQGCTMIPGQDYDQVFASTLRTSSVRTLFAFAAKYNCFIRSVDWVAAYLQGELQEGEVVYCHMPSGYEQNDPSGHPYCLEICKPIYGMPQAGRRFQRSIFPWLREQSLCQLDDSDSGIWVYRPNGTPTAAPIVQNNSVTALLSKAPDPEVYLSSHIDPAKVEAALAAYRKETKAEEQLVCGVYVDNLQIIHSSPMT